MAETEKMTAQDRLRQAMLGRRPAPVRSPELAQPTPSAPVPLPQAALSANFFELARKRRVARAMAAAGESPALVQAHIQRERSPEPKPNPNVEVVTSSPNLNSEAGQAFVPAPTPAPSPPSPPAPAADAPKMSVRDRLRALSLAAPQEASGEFGESDFDHRDDQDAGPAGDAAPESISGTLVNIRIFGDWGTATVWTDDRNERRVTGQALIELTEGLEYTFHGKTKNHPKYGEGLEVSAYEPIISVDVAAMQQYMVKNFKGIGPARASKFLQGFVDASLTLAHEIASRALTDEEKAEAKMLALSSLRDKLLHEPWTIDLGAIAGKAAFEAGEDPQAAAKVLVLTRNLMLRLGSQQGFKESVAKALAVYLLGKLAPSQGEGQGEGSTQPPPPAGDIVESSWRLLITNPYKPISEVSGYGFGMAEIVAKMVGVPRDSGMRLAALVDYAVEQACERRGHTYLSARDLKEAIERVDPTVSAQSALVHGIKEELIVLDAAKNRIYTPTLHQAEISLSQGIARLLQPSDSLTERDASSVIAKLKKDAGKINEAFAKNGLDEVQLKSVASIMTTPTRLHVLTGGPGTGKTSIVECLVYLLKRKDFVFCAPTGKAAKVLTKRVSSMGYSARTVNSLLQGGVEGGFKVNEKEPLSCDVLVVDESTMNGVEMADALIKALPSHAHIIFLGDPGLPARADCPQGRAGQLPSISPGRFMADLLEMEGVNHVHLKTTHRNSGGILEVVNEVGDSHLNVTDREAVRFHGLPDPKIGFPLVMADYLECVERAGVENTLLVMPKRQGDRLVAGWNTTYANHVLRNTCNPFGQRLPGTTLHLGDRILIRQNLKLEQPTADNYGRLAGSVAAPGAPSQTESPIDFGQLNKDLEALNAARQRSSDFEPSPDITDGLEEPKKPETVMVVNGDTGTIIAFRMNDNNSRLGSPRWVRLALDDGREIEMPGTELGALDHAYALTVHSAQGSEYKNVIMCVTPGTADFMNQNMIFTGFSRAKDHLSVYGETRDLKRIAATAMPKRNSALVERVALALQESSEEELPTPANSDGD